MRHTHIWVFLVTACVVCITVVLIVIRIVSWNASGTCWGLPSVCRADEDDAWKMMRAFKYALCDYQIAYGQLPYDRRGPENALYKLRDILRSGGLVEGAWAKDVVFDEEAGRLVSRNIEYANISAVLWDLPPRFVLFAESRRGSRSGRWVCFADESIQFIDDPDCRVGSVYPTQRE